MEKTKHGMTLVEYMIIVVIIGLLAAIFTPFLKRQRELNNQTSMRALLNNKVEKEEVNTSNKVDNSNKVEASYNIDQYNITVLSVDKISKTSYMVIVGRTGWHEINVLMVPKNGGE